MVLSDQQATEPEALWVSRGFHSGVGGRTESDIVINE